MKNQKQLKEMVEKYFQMVNELKWLQKSEQDKKKEIYYLKIEIFKLQEDILCKS